MSKYTIFIILPILFTFSLLNFVNVDASSVSIYTDKPVYDFGDYLSYTIEVSEVTGKPAILHITDESGKTSSPITIPITKTKSTFTAPFPFDPVVYTEGKYILDVEYDGSKDSTEFNLINSGKVVIPFWIRDFANYWVNDAVSDIEYAKGIEYLIKNDIIVVPQTENQQYSEIKIPSWIKISTKWWIDGKISDEEHALSLQYLIKIGVIIV